MAEGFYATEVDDKGRRIYDDAGAYIPLWKREGRSTPTAQSKKAGGGGAGAGIAGVGAMVAGKYLQHKIPSWIGGKGAEVAAKGAADFFGSAGTGANIGESLGAPISESLGGEALSGGGGFGGGAGGGATTSFLADTLPAVGAYAVPLLAAAGMAYGLNKQYGAPKSRREPSNWGKALASGYKYAPENASTWTGDNTKSDFTVGDLANSSTPARMLGNAWMEKLTEEQRNSAIQKLMDQGGVNERLGGYDFDKSAFAKLVDSELIASGATPFAQERLSEGNTRQDALRQFMYGAGHMGGERSGNMRNLIESGMYQNPQDNKFSLGADWMPQSYLDAVAKLKAQP